MKDKFKDEEIYGAVVTKYLAPTTHRGARVKAKWLHKSIIVPWDYSLSKLTNHFIAAGDVCDMDSDYFMCARLPDKATGFTENGYVFTYTKRRSS